MCSLSLLAYPVSALSICIEHVTSVNFKCVLYSTTEKTEKQHNEDNINQITYGVHEEGMILFLSTV
jgi:hypothetical protein